jgi:hypothetical protein
LTMQDRRILNLLIVNGGLRPNPRNVSKSFEINGLL